jgi:hypothetical protein
MNDPSRYDPPNPPIGAPCRAHKPSTLPSLQDGEDTKSSRPSYSAPQTQSEDSNVKVADSVPPTPTSSASRAATVKAQSVMTGSIGQSSRKSMPRRHEAVPLSSLSRLRSRLKEVSTTVATTTTTAAKTASNESDLPPLDIELTYPLLSEL